MLHDNMTQNQSTPPVAQKEPIVLELHGDRRIDNYFWMRDIENPQVTAYLEAENKYTEEAMKSTTDLQQQLYDEILSRIKETDLSVPVRKDNYYYYSRTEVGKAYAIHCRKEGNDKAPEQILLDENELASGQEYFNVGVFQISPNHEILAYAVDNNGSERYTIYFLDLKTFKLYPETISDTYYSFAWANDNQTVFYTQVDEANRPFKLFRHQSTLR